MVMSSKSSRILSISALLGDMALSGLVGLYIDILREVTAVLIIHQSVALWGVVKAKTHSDFEDSNKTS